MRNPSAGRDGFVLIKSPNHRQQAARRKLAVVAGIVALAVASGVIGSLTAPKATVVGQATTGPFSYFPSQ